MTKHNLTPKDITDIRQWLGESGFNVLQLLSQLAPEMTVTEAVELLTPAERG